MVSALTTDLKAYLGDKKGEGNMGGSLLKNDGSLGERIGNVWELQASRFKVLNLKHVLVG